VAQEGGKDRAGPQWENRRHFFAAAAEAMRRSYSFDVVFDPATLTDKSEIDGVITLPD
jgi:hypothetical protein